MKRIFHPYHKWECFQQGMYQEKIDVDHIGRVQQSMVLLRNLRQLEKAMAAVAEKWHFSSEVYLSYSGYNRRAWLGQAACCYAHLATETETKEAWNFLAPEEMERANAVADKVIRNWERRHKLEKLS